jgi:hypothetical protein
MLTSLFLLRKIRWVELVKDTSVHGMTGRHSACICPLDPLQQAVPPCASCLPVRGASSWEPQCSSLCA